MEQGLDLDLRVLLDYADKIPGAGRVFFGRAENGPYPGQVFVEPFLVIRFCHSKNILLLPGLDHCVLNDRIPKALGLAAAVQQPFPA
jgi:hypothetical protein